jgi:hypothetical protein
MIRCRSSIPKGLGNGARLCFSACDRESAPRPANRTTLVSRNGREHASWVISERSVSTDVFLLFFSCSQGLRGELFANARMLGFESFSFDQKIQIISGKLWTSTSSMNLNHIFFMCIKSHIQLHFPQCIQAVNIFFQFRYFYFPSDEFYFFRNEKLSV